MDARANKSQFLRSAVVAAAILAWFFAKAWRGLTKPFSGDDMMNLYHAWDFPLGNLLTANLTPFTRVYRPAGGIVYRALFAIFGLHPIPFRIAVYVLLVLNLGLVYWFAKLVVEQARPKKSGSLPHEVGALAALLFAYHNRAMDIYVSGGTIYDVLCATFFVCAGCVYIRGRSGGGPMSWRSLLLFVVLNIAALNAKEMAATLFLVLAAYELLFHRSLSLRNALGVWISLAMTVIAAKIRTGPGTPFAGNADYEIHLTAHQFFLTTRRLLDDLFVLDPEKFTIFETVLVFAAVWAIAILARRRDLLLAACFLTVTPLPVNFITYRGFFVMYLPLVGWSMYFAIAAVAARDWLLQRVWHRPELKPGWEPERVALFLFTLFLLFDVYGHDSLRSFSYPDDKQTRIQNLRAALERIHHPLPGGAKVLFVSDALRVDDLWMPLTVTRLYYRDPSLVVDLEPRGKQYDLVLELCEQSYCVVAQ